MTILKEPKRNQETIKFTIRSHICITISNRHDNQTQAALTTIQMLFPEFHYAINLLLVVIMYVLKLFPCKSFHYKEARTTSDTRKNI